MLITITGEAALLSVNDQNYDKAKVFHNSLCRRTVSFLFTWQQYIFIVFLQAFTYSVLQVGGDQEYQDKNIAESLYPVGFLQIDGAKINRAFQETKLVFYRGLVFVFLENAAIIPLSLILDIGYENKSRFLLAEMLIIIWF